MNAERGARAATLLALASTLGLAATLQGCAATECNDALDKLLGECGFSAAALDGAIVQCEDRPLCEAECVLDSDCEDIVSTDANNSYDKCRAECAKNP